jgi:hypothetical protein
MHPLTTRPALARRDFLKYGVLAGVIAAVGFGTFEYAPWLDYDERTADPRRAFPRGAAGDVRMRAIVRYASLAASGHNTQPWRFAIAPDAIEIRPDLSRRLPVVDPDDREMWISLGCALENLLVAARASGLAPQVELHTDSDLIRVKLTPDTAMAGHAFEAIPLRQNTRSRYDGRIVVGSDLDLLHAVPLEPGIVARIAVGPEAMKPHVEYVHRANMEQYADKAFLKELVHWVRFDRREALASLDGLYAPCAGSPEVPRWLGQMFVTSTTPQQQADADTVKLRSSPGVCVIASESDDKDAWVRTGQVYERLALTMTSLGIRSAFLNQPNEMRGLRPQFQSALGLGTAQPQLLVRFGHAKAMPLSLRRPVEQILT